MIVKFLGMKTALKTTGCSSCGGRRVSSYGFESMKTFYLPSGQKSKFVYGEEADVMDTDGAFLLLQKDDDGNQMFERV